MGQWTIFHPAVFFLTFTSYALFHVVRKTLSYVKSSITGEWTPSTVITSFPGDAWSRRSLFQDHDSAEAFLGILNATFLFVYAVGLYFSGMVADRLDLRIFLSAGMILSAVAIFIFGPVLEWSGSYSQPVYISLMVLNGLLQSTGWPCVVAVMGNWFGKGSRGLVLGLWSASPSVGSILGALMVSTVVGYGYEHAFMISSCVLFAGGVLVFFGLVTSPREVGLPMPDECDDVESDTARTVTVTSDDGVRNLLQTRSLGCLSTGFSKKNADVSSDLEEKEPLQRKSLPHNFYGSTRNVVDAESKTDARVEFYSGQKKTKRSVLTRRRRSDTMSLLYAARETHSDHRATGAAYDNFADDKSMDLRDELMGDPDEAETGATGNADSVAEPCGHEKSTRFQEQIKSGTRNQHRNHTDTVAKLTNSSCLANADRNIEAGIAASTAALACSGLNTLRSNKRPKAISFFRALLLPGVIPYSLAYAFLKMVNYVFFFWLPFYLSSSYGWPESAADQLSVWYDVGGIVGGTVAGVLGNRFNKRALVVAVMLVMAVPMLYVYKNLNAGQDMTINAFMLVCLGGLIGGVANIISAAISADLGRQDAIRGNVEALSTVAGIIEGTGTMGAALGQLAVPYMKAAFGWGSVFFFLMVAISLAVVNILPIVVVEVKAAVRSRRQR